MENEVKLMFKETDYTYSQIAKQLGCHIWIVQDIITKSFSKEEISKRKTYSYSRSRMAELNPMFNKTREKHHAFKEEVEDGYGYVMVLKPDWYTGRKGSRHVFKHSVVMCEVLGLTEIPKGFCVHHVDGDKKNNNVNNLALLSTSAHMRLHALERATTSRKA